MDLGIMWSNTAYCTRNIASIILILLHVKKWFDLKMTYSYIHKVKKKSYFVKHRQNVQILRNEKGHLERSRSISQEYVLALHWVYGAR